MPFLWYLDVALHFRLFMDKALFLGLLDTHCFFLKITHIIWNLEFRRIYSVSITLLLQKQVGSISEFKICLLRLVKWHLWCILISLPSPLSSLFSPYTPDYSGISLDIIDKSVLKPIITCSLFHYSGKMLFWGDVPAPFYLFLFRNTEFLSLTSSCYYSCS